MKISWFTARLMDDLCATTQMELASMLVNMGHEVTIINGDKRGSVSEHAWNHVALASSKIRGLRSKSLGRSMKKWAQKEHAQSFDVAIVDWRIASSIIPVLNMLNKPWILMDRSPPADSNIFAILQWPSWNRAWRYVRQSAHGKGCTVSSGHKSYVEKKIHCQPEKIVVLNAGVDIHMFKPGKKTLPLALVYHGRVDKNRGVMALPMLLQKARSLGIECKLFIIGQGDAYNGLKRIAEKEQWFELLPTVSRKKLATLLGQCDIGLLPMPETKIWKMASPLKRSEYFASGLLVFGIDHEGHRIHRGNSPWMKLVPQHDFHEEGCSWLKSLNEEKIKRLSQQSRKYAETELSWEFPADLLEQSLLDVLT